MTAIAFALHYAMMALVLRLPPPAGTIYWVADTAGTTFLVTEGGNNLIFA